VEPQGGLGLAPSSVLALHGRIVREVRLVVTRAFLFFLPDTMAFLSFRRKMGKLENRKSHDKM
jgi:hypothetical protein